MAAELMRFTCQGDCMPQEDRIFRYLDHIHHQDSEKIGSLSYPHEVDDLSKISNALLLPEFLRAKNYFYACSYCSTDPVTKRLENVDPFHLQRLRNSFTEIRTEIYSYYQQSIAQGLFETYMPSLRNCLMRQR